MRYVVYQQETHRIQYMYVIHHLSFKFHFADISVTFHFPSIISELHKVTANANSTFATDAADAFIAFT